MSQLFTTYRPKPEHRKCCQHCPTRRRGEEQEGFGRRVNQTEASLHRPLPSRENLGTTVWSWRTCCLEMFLFFSRFQRAASGEAEATSRISIDGLLLTSHLAGFCSAIFSTARWKGGREKKKKKHARKAQEHSCAPPSPPRTRLLCTSEAEPR